MLQKPELDRMWEVFIRIPPEINMNNISDLYTMIRSKVFPLVAGLMESGKIRWYSFLIHDRHSGVPTSVSDNGCYFHIRFSLSDSSISRIDVVNSLVPNFCSKHLTRKCPDVQSISGIDKTLLKNEEVEEAWRVIGEQSECVIRILGAYKEDVKVPVSQMEQFMHFFSNMTQLRIR